jgi:hypothetical protein
MVLPWSVQDGRARVKATLADSDVFSVLFHLLHILIVLPPVDEFGDRPSVLMLLCHAA